MTERSDPFESAFFMCDWADRAIAQFEGGARAFLDQQAPEFRPEFNAETGLNELKLRFGQSIPMELRGHGSDAIKNVRDALDQAMAAASFVVTGKRSKRTHFPFGESADDLEYSLSRKKVAQCKDIPEDLFDTIRAIKPYPHEFDDALKALNLVSGNHKHAVALTQGVNANGLVIGTVSFSRGGGLCLPPKRVPNSAELVIATFPKGSVARVDVQVPVFIAIDHPLLIDNPAIDVLKYWAGRVRAIVRGLKAASEKVVSGRI